MGSHVKWGRDAAAAGAGQPGFGLWVAQSAPGAGATKGAGTFLRRQVSPARHLARSAGRRGERRRGHRACEEVPGRGSDTAKRGLAELCFLGDEGCTAVVPPADPRTAAAGPEES